MVRMDLLVMGACASGKTSVTSMFAKRPRWLMLEADRLHPLENIRKMSAAIPLDDDDRRKTMDNIRAAMLLNAAAGSSSVIAFSALRRSYRDYLRLQNPDLKLVYLRISKHGALRRASERYLAGKSFMPPALVESQFVLLEEPDSDEQALIVDVGAESVEAIAARIAQWFSIP